MARKAARAHRIVDGRREAGAFDVVAISEDFGLARPIAERNPDLVLTSGGSPSHDALEDQTRATAPLRRPVAMVLDRSDAALTRAAIEAVMSAHVVDWLLPKRLKPIQNTAIARFHMVQKWRVERAETRRALEERKRFDRAKGVLMRARGIGEDEACTLLRKAAMDQGRKIVDPARVLVLATDLLKWAPRCWWPRRWVLRGRRGWT